MTEQLTPRANLAYPLNRRIMDQEPNIRRGVDTRPKPQGEAPNPDTQSRFDRLVARVNGGKKENVGVQVRAKIEADKKKAEEKNAGGSAPGDGNFSKIDPEKFKQNTSLYELAKKLQIAGRQGRINNELLEEVQKDLDKRVGLGLVSENWRWQFTNYLRGFVLNANTPIIGDYQQTAENIGTIVEQRKTNGIDAAGAQATRIVWENALGRKLSEAELARITTGKESTVKPVSKEFTNQLQIIEKVATSPKRFDAFVKSIENMDPESVRQAMKGKAGELVLMVLLGDVAERDDLVEKFRKALGKNGSEVKYALAKLTYDIQDREAEETPIYGDEKAQEAERIRLAKDLRDNKQKKIAEIEKKYEGIVEMAGGADYEASLNGFLEDVNRLPDELTEENADEFEYAKLSLGIPELIGVMASEMYPPNDPRIMQEVARFAALNEIEDPKEFKPRITALLRNFQERYKAAQNDPSREEERKQGGKLADQMSRTGEVTKNGKSYRDLEWVSHNFWHEPPRNVIDLATWIVSSNDLSTWGPDGVYPIFKLHPTEKIQVEKKIPNTNRVELVDVRKPDFQAGNFIRWLRNKSLEHHNDNSNDPISLLQSVSIETLQKTVSIGTMKYNQQQYFSDENGELLEALADEVIGEAWLFSERRNNNLAYIQNMTADGELYKTVLGMSAKNNHTSSTNLVNHLRMGEEFDGKEGNLDHKVGDAMVMMSQIYRNLSDINRLYQVVPKDSPLFTLEGFKNASRVLNKQGFNEETHGHGNLTIDGDNIYFTNPKTKVKKYIFKDSKLVVRDKGKNEKVKELAGLPENLIEYLNFFPSAGPDETNEQFVRELVKQSVAELVGFHTGASREQYDEFNAQIRKTNPDHKEIEISKYRKLARVNLEWAEVNSWVEQRWSGAASRNDTGYRGYDAWTKLYAQYYRERQSGPRTAGPIGNPHDMQIFRMMGPDMWLAIRTESGTSVQEVFDSINALNMKIYALSEDSAERKEYEEQKKKAYELLKFPRWTESDWASNGFKRQFEVWHNVMETEDIKFNDIVKKDNWGILKFDRAKFEEIVKDDFIKKRRYAFSSNNAMNYGALTRIREKVSLTFDKDGKPVEEFAFKDKYLAEAMFGEIVMGSIRREWYDGELSFEAGDEDGKRVKKRASGGKEKLREGEQEATFGDYLNSDAAREKILKNVCRAGLAAQIKAHRERGGLDERWDNHSVRKFYAALRSMPQYVQDPVTGKQIKLDDQQFFRKEDIDWIRRQSGTTKKRMLMEDAAFISADILAGALPGAFKTFFNDVISS